MPQTVHSTNSAMDQSNLSFSSLPQNFLETPVSCHSPHLFGTGPSGSGDIKFQEDSLTDAYFQTFNEFDAAFGFVSNPNSSYPEPPSGSQSPTYSHSHDDTTSDEAGDFFPSKEAISVKSRSMETRRRKPRNQKTIQPQDQILKRRVQNRAAQRSFRERQKEYVHDLEHQVEQLKGEISKLHENYQELLKAVTSAPRIQQWSADMSPTSLDDLEYNGSVDEMSPVKVEGNLWPVELSRDYQSLLY